MAKYKLGEICTVVSGSTPKTEVSEYWNGDFKWITPAEIDDETYIVDDTVRKITRLAIEKTGLSPFPAGTVILSSRAPIGKVAIAGCEMYCNQGFKNLICSDVIDNKYLYWYLKSKTEYLNSLGRGATFKEISKSIVEQIEVDIPDKDEQIKIASRFEAVTEAIKICEEEIAIFDKIVKARFVEMFGDILTNRKLPLVQLSELADIGSSKRIYANEYVEEGIPFYRSKEIRELGSGLKPSVELFIKPERYNEIKEKYGVPKVGDILIAAIGATIGYSWIVNTENPFYYKDGNLIILSIKEGVNPIFLNHTMGILIEDFKNKGVAGSAQLALTIEKLEKMVVVSPDIELQNQFAEFVKQVDKSKSVARNILGKLTTLQASLMQEYFG